MSKGNKRLLILVIVLSALVAAAGVVLLIPYMSQNADSEDFLLSASRRPDGSWQLTWPRFSSDGTYTVDVKKGSSVVFSENSTGEKIVLPKTLDGESCRIKITGKDPTDEYRTITVSDRILFTDMPVKDLDTEFDGETGTMRASWSQEGDSYAVYEVLEGHFTKKNELESPEMEIRFNGDDGFTMPPEDGTVLVGAAGVRKQGHVKVTGSVYQIAELKRKDFNGLDLQLSCELNPDNTADLSWQETRAESYKVLCSSDGKEFSTVAVLDGETLSYKIPKMKPLSRYQFRILGLSSGGKVICDEKTEASTGITPLYCTIWLNRRLPVFSGPDRAAKTGEAGPEGTFCVLDEDAESGMFKIRISDGEYGWVESRYCMINLPDYIGDLVSYDITNSYKSLFTFHEYEINGLSGRIVTGYESVHQKDGSFLVPLLYPTAKKLTDAANAAAEQGLRLKLYDTYRPKKSTLSIYETAVAVLNDPVPASTWTGNKVEIPAIPEAGRNESLLRDFVINGGWGMSAFLGYGGSNHNKGTAIDMGLEDPHTGETMKAQTAMHDLSVYSVRPSNNANAETLSRIMTGAGFGTLVSEWWHFEDSEFMRLYDPSFRDNGVSARGWYYDGIGWQYRDELGSCLVGVSMTENGKEYSFNSNGYLTSTTPT